MSRLGWLFLWRRQHDDLTREMDAHIAERVDALVDDGMSEAEARLQARREFGNVTVQTERSREVWIARWLTSVWQDLRYAVRSLRRQPGFTLSAVGILAIGIGLVMTLFTFVNGLLVRPWLVPEASTLALLSPRPAPNQPQTHNSLSHPEYHYLRDNSQSFSQLAAWMPSHVRGAGGARLLHEGASIGVEPLFVSANYFETLGITTQVGRTFGSADEDYSAPAAVAIISDHLWRHLFSASESLPGTTVIIDDHPFTVVGVAPREFRGVLGAPVDVWLPLPSVALGRFGVSGRWSERFADPLTNQTQVVGRLATGVSHAAAAAEVTGLSQQWRASLSLPSHGFSVRDTRPISAASFSAASTTTLGQVSGVGFVFLALLLVMLLACANVGNLILARGMSRTRETAIRLSLGSSRSRIVAQFMTEALLLSAAAAGLGLWIGWMTSVVILRSPHLGVRFDEARLGPDIVVFGFVAGLATLAALLSGLAPSLRLSRGNIAHRAGNRHMGDPSTGRLRTGLLAVQIGLSMILLVSAGLMTRAAARALSYDPGFAIHEVQALTFGLGDADDERRRVFTRTLDDALRQASMPPHAFSEFRAITGGHRNADVRRMNGDLEISRQVIVRNVSPTYFATLSIPIVKGRAPALDGASGEVVINESVARALWRNGDPLGERLTMGRGGSQRDVVVVGVSADVPVIALGRIDPVVYDTSNTGNVLLVRSLAPATVQQVRGIAQSLEPGVQVTSAPLSDDLQDSANLPMFGSYFAWGLGGLALVLATAGAFGVFAYMVEERRREIGVRMALGATSASVVRTVVSGARWPLVFGLGGGLILSMLAARLLRGALYGLSPFDPITYIGIAGVLTVAALVATWVPARRATRIDPAITLRGD